MLMAGLEEVAAVAGPALFITRFTALAAAKDGENDRAVVA
jgi:hypothetical protein